MTLQGPQRRKPAPGSPQRSLQRRNPVPQGPIWARFSILFGTNFNQISILDRNGRSRKNLVNYEVKSLSALSNSVDFSIARRYKFDFFPIPFPWSVFGASWPRFGIPSAARWSPNPRQWRPNGARIRQKGFPKSAKRQPGTRLGSVLVAPPALRTRPFPTDPPFGPILERF